MNDQTKDNPASGTISGADGEIIQLSPVDDEFEGSTRPAVVEAPERVDAPTPAEPRPAESSEPGDHSFHFPKSIAREYFESMIVTFIMALFGMTFITQAVKVPTGSMLNTILVEDHLMVNKFIFGPHASALEGVLPYRDIRRGDIIVFKYPKGPETNYVKRVIGLPGETIEIHGTTVYINGKVLPENKQLAFSPGLNEDLELMGPPKPVEGATHTSYYNSIRDEGDPDDTEFGSLVSGDFGDFGVRTPFTIPPDSYFVMGDNRDNSEDSRSWGVVPRENVVGRAMFVYWSIRQAERMKSPGSNILVDMFTHTRWGRTGTLIR